MTPQTNTQLFGHDAAEAQLLEGFKNGKLAHGWIIGGPEGIGKATLAYRFARTLLSGKTDLDENDPVFRRIIAGSHADLLVVQPEWDDKKDERKQEISVEQAREIGKFLSLTPGEGAWRVVIVDSADALNANGANAILKILEEPPPQAVLLLVSHQPGRLLPTIRSRCRMLPLKALNEPDFLDALRPVAPEVTGDERKALAQLSAYSPGVALQLKEQGALEMYDNLLTLLSRLPALDAAGVHTFAEQLVAGQAHANWRLLSRLVLHLFARAAKQVPGVSRQEDEVLKRLEALHPPGMWAMKWQQALDQFSLAQARHLDYKQLAIVFLHSIASNEGFQIGIAAA